MYVHANVFIYVLASAIYKPALKFKGISNVNQISMR